MWRAGLGFLCGSGAGPGAGCEGVLDTAWGPSWGQTHLQRLRQGFVAERHRRPALAENSWLAALGSAGLVFAEAPSRRASSPVHGLHPVCLALTSFSQKTPVLPW